MIFEYLWTIAFAIFVIKLVTTVLRERRRRLHRTEEALDNIPGPPGIPLFGNLLTLSAHVDNTVKLFQVDWKQQYGDLYKVSLGSLKLLHVSSPELIKVVLKSTSIITKGSNYDQIKDWVGEGLLTSTGSVWKTHRRLLTPAFHFNILDNFFPVFNQQSRIFARCIHAAISSNQNNEIDVFPFVNRCTLDIICGTVTGVSVNVQTNSDSSYAQAVQKMAHLAMKRAYSPWLKSNLLFGLTSQGREYRKVLKTLHDFTTKVIRKKDELLGISAIDSCEESNDADNVFPQKKKTFLDLFLSAAEDGELLTERELREEVDTFMFAGHDTNSAAITWFLYLMASNPKEQDKVYGELKEVFGDSNRSCTKEDSRNLKYLECCIKESLRLLPPVPSYRRTVTEHFKLGEYIVPTGWNIVICAYAVHHNPEYYPDPEVFRPERFFPENCIGRHPFAYIPFSAGPRNCIGQKFAMLEQKVVLSTLLREFKVELSPHIKLDPKQDIILRPRDALLLRFLPRT